MLHLKKTKEQNTLFARVKLKNAQVLFVLSDLSLKKYFMPFITLMATMLPSDCGESQEVMFLHRVVARFLKNLSSGPEELQLQYL